MILPFKKEFVPLILNGTKIHTIREDKKNRWKPGNIIHMATGVRSKHYNCFAEKVCTSVQDIEFIWFNDVAKGWVVYVFAGDSCVTGINNGKKFDALCKGDGFQRWEDFLLWPAWNKKYFKGKLIHWTDKKY